MAAAIVLCTFAGCGKKKDSVGKEKETTASTTTTTTTAAETVEPDPEDEKKEEPETSSTTTTTAVTKKAKSEPDKLLTAAEKDKKNFAEFMSYILGYGRQYASVDFSDAGEEGYSEKEAFDARFENYDCKAENAGELVCGYLAGIWYYNMFDFIGETYSTDKEYYGKECGTLWGEKTGDRDPLKKYCEECRYFKADGEKTDALIKNVFNATPDHDYVLESDSEYDGGVYEYYYKGNYYFYEGEGGDGEGPMVEIKSMEKLPDGKYSFKIEYIWGNSDIHIYMGTLNVTAGLKLIDGSRMWSIYEITKVD